MVVTAGGNHLDGAIVHIDDGHVEGTASEVIHEHGLLLGRLHAVCDGGSSGLVDDTQHVESGNLSGLLGLHALLGAEIGWTGNHDIIHRFGIVAQVVGILHEFLQDEGRDFRGVTVIGEGVGGLVEGGIHTHAALDEAHGVLGLGHEHAFGIGSHNTLVFTLEIDNGGGGETAVEVGEHYRLVKLVHLCDTAIGGSQVNAVDGTGFIKFCHDN